ncbi:hypothetical protein LINPERPRIM_LOCUS25116 [Linum perenne]
MKCWICLLNGKCWRMVLEIHELAESVIEVLGSGSLVSGA